MLQAVRLGFTSLTETFPPYRKIEGRLIAKENGSGGRYYLLIGEELIEVDWITHDILMIGEALKIRATRSNKAINIDRLVP